MKLGSKPIKSFLSGFLLLTILGGSFFAPILTKAETRPNDPEYSNQWYLDSIGAPAAWDYGTGSKKVVVAVLDTGVEIIHPDLQENIWVNPQEKFNGVDDDMDGYVDDVYGWDFVDNQSNPGPDLISVNTTAGLHHGTIVAGIIGAIGNNGTDGAGINWKVSIMSLRVLNNEGQGDADNVADAVNYAIDHHADIINMSFVGVSPGEKLREAIWRADRAGILIVAAGGNDASNGTTDGSLDSNRQFPACFDGPGGEKWGVVGVAALDKNDQKATFSDYGFDCIDIAAPGVEISGDLVFSPSRAELSNSFGGNWAGTSLAAPIVSGAAAFLKSLNPNLKAPELYNLLTLSALPLINADASFGNQLGAGKLSLGRAVELSGVTKVGQATAVKDTIKKPTHQLLVYRPATKVTKFYDINGKIKKYTNKLVNLTKKDLPKKVLLAYNSYKGRLGIALGDIDGDLEKEFIVVKTGKNPIAIVWSLDGFKKSEIKIKGDYRSGIGLIVN